MPNEPRPQGLVCVVCRGPLEQRGSSLECAACSLSFPIETGIADFALGAYFDSFTSASELSSAAVEGLAFEVEGVRARIADFYAPLLRALPTNGRRLRVLDSGCGNGLSVDLLQAAGLDAWGNDCSRLRKWQWRERAHRERLVVADTRRLPFPDGFFDAVVSSGVLEHVGVDESRCTGYEVVPRAGKRAEREAFLAELLRVTAANGRLYLDFPNGAFPIDFWHGDAPGAARWHSVREGFLPTVREVRDHLSCIGDCSLRPLSPRGRLRMRQVGRHWYGRALRPAVEAFLWLASRAPFRGLAGSPLNPYLVLEVSRNLR